MLLSISFVNGGASDFMTVDGYYKNFFVVYHQPEYEIAGISIDNPEKGAVNNRIRLDFSREITSWLNIKAAYSPALRIQDNSLFYSDPLQADINSLSYRAVDFDSRLYPCEDDTVASFAVFHNLDRFYCGIKASDFDLYIGRQAIAWGSARVINPTDVLAPYRFEELDTEERIGVDAVRIRIPLGMLSEFDAGAVMGGDFKLDSSAAFLRGKFYTMKADISAVLIGFKENILAGFDLATSWKGAGIWLESAYVWADALKEGSNDSGDNNYMRASLGCDYSFGDRTYGFVEYSYNQAGSVNSDDYMNLLTETAYTEGSVYLLGEHYLIPGLSYQITPLMIYNGQLLTNLNDPSVYFYSMVEYNFADNIYLSAGAFVGIGEKPELITQPVISARLNSEFGTYPDIYFTSFNIYF